MEKLKQQSRIFSIIGGIMVIILAFNVLLDFFVNNFVRQIQFNFGSFLLTNFNLASFVILFIFLLVLNRSNKLLIIYPAINLVCLFFSVFYSVFPYLSYGELEVAISMIIRNIPIYLCTLLLNASIILIICFATDKKTKLINGTWFIPFVICLLQGMLVVYNCVNSIEVCTDMLNEHTSFGPEFKELLQYSIYSSVKTIIMQPITIILYLMLGLWLKTKNRILRGEGPQIIEKPVQPIYQPPIQRPFTPQPSAQPQVERPFTPQPSAQPQFERPFTPQQSAQPQYHIVAETQNRNYQFKQQPQADEFEKIKKYKELLDAGIITQEEFNQKKKEILNL